jgi:hypothetical protein
MAAVGERVVLTSSRVRLCHWKNIRQLAGFQPGLPCEAWARAVLGGPCCLHGGSGLGLCWWLVRP